MSAAYGNMENIARGGRTKIISSCRISSVTGKDNIGISVMALASSKHGVA
jgi:hypothetical protein